MSDQPDNPTPQPPATAPGAAQSSTVPNAGQSQGEGQDKKTFTQDELDKLMGERAKRAREALLKEFGFEKADDLKALLKAAKEREDAEKTELEKAQAKLTDALAKAEAAEKHAAELEQARLRDSVDNEIRKVAVENKANDPEDVVLLIRQAGAEVYAEFLSDDGKVKAEAVKKRVQAIAKEKPYWFTAAQRGPGSPSNNNGNASLPDPKKALENKRLFKL